MGSRGAGPVRAAGYGNNLKDYVTTANDELLVGIQIRDRRGALQCRIDFVDHRCGHCFCWTERFDIILGARDLIVETQR